MKLHDRISRFLCAALAALTLLSSTPAAAAAGALSDLVIGGTSVALTGTTAGGQAAETGSQSFSLTGTTTVNLTATTSGNLTATTSAAVLIPDGDYLVALASDKTKGWNIGFGSKVIDQANLIVDNLIDRESHEIFRIINRGGGMISIHPLHALDLCLNAQYGAACTYGSKVTLHNFEKGDLASYWIPTKNANGTFTIKNAACPYVIELYSNRYQIGNTFRLYPRSTTKPGQTFWFMPVTAAATGAGLSDGDYVVGLASDKTKGWNIGFGSTVIDQANLIVDNLPDREAHEIFRVINRGNGLVTIHPTHALGLCLNSQYGAACRNGSYVTLHNFEEGDMASYWQPIQNSNGTYSIKNAASGYVIELSGNSYTIGNHLIHATWTGSAKQTFWFIPVSTPSAQNLVQTNINKVTFIKQKTSTCKATAAAMAANLIVGANTYKTDSMIFSGVMCRNMNGETYRGSDGNTYKVTYKTDTYVGSLSEVTAAVEKAVSSDLPIVVAVHKTGGTKHHWVLITGKDSSGNYLVSDPARSGNGTIAASLKTMSALGYSFGLTDYSTTHYGYISFTKV